MNKQTPDIFSANLRQTSIGKQIASLLTIEKTQDDKLILKTSLEREVEPLSFAYQKLNQALNP